MTSEEEEAEEESEIIENFKKLTPEERYRGLIDYRSGQLQRINQRIRKKEGKLEDEKVKGLEKNDLLYEIKELEVERDLKQNELDRLNAEVKKGYVPLNKLEKEPYKVREEGLKDQLKKIKQDRKSGILLISAEEANEVSQLYSEEELREMTRLKLKSTRMEVKSKLGKKRTALKLKGRSMSEEKREEMKRKIASLEEALELINKEIASREEE